MIALTTQVRHIQELFNEQNYLFEFAIECKALQTNQDEDTQEHFIRLMGNYSKNMNLYQSILVSLAVAAEVESNLKGLKAVNSARLRKYHGC